MSGVSLLLADNEFAEKAGLDTKELNQKEKEEEAEDLGHNGVTEAQQENAMQMMTSMAEARLRNHGSNRMSKLTGEQSARLGQANTYFIDGKFEKVVAICKELMEQQPKAPSIYSLMGLVFESTGNQQKALDAFAVAALMDSTEENWKRVCKMARAQNRMQLVAYALKRGERCAKREERGLYRRERGLLLVGSIGGDMGDHNNIKQGCRILEALLAENPHDVEVIEMIVKGYTHLGNDKHYDVLDRYVAMYLSASAKHEIPPISVNILNYACESLMERESFERIVEVIDHLSDSLQGEEGELELFTCRAIAQLRLGQGVNAVPTFDRLFKEDADDYGDLFLEVAEAQLAMELWDDALSTLSLIPQDSEYDTPRLWKLKAHCHYQKAYYSRTEEPDGVMLETAMDFFERVLEEEEDDETILRTLQDIYDKLELHTERHRMTQKIALLSRNIVDHGSIDLVNDKQEESKVRGLLARHSRDFVETLDVKQLASKAVENIMARMHSYMPNDAASAIMSIENMSKRTFIDLTGSGNDSIGTLSPLDQLTQLGTIAKAAAATNTNRETQSGTHNDIIFQDSDMKLGSLSGTKRKSKFEKSQVAAVGILYAISSDPLSNEDVLIEQSDLLTFKTQCFRLLNNEEKDLDERSNRYLKACVPKLRSTMAVILGQIDPVRLYDDFVSDDENENEESDEENYDCSFSARQPRKKRRRDLQDVTKRRTILGYVKEVVGSPEFFDLIMNAIKSFVYFEEYKQAEALIQALEGCVKSKVMTLTNQDSLDALNHIRYLMIAVSYHGGNYERAYTYIRWAINQQPKDTALVKLLNDIIYKLQFHTKCSRFVSRVLEHHPDSVPLRILMGNMNLMHTSYSQALDQYLHALQYSPDQPRVHLFIAIVLIQLCASRTTEDPHWILTKAMCFLNKYYNKCTNKAEAAYNMGRSLHYLGMVHLAVRYYQDVIALPGDTLKKEAAHNLARIYINSGSSELAKSIYDQYVVI